ncbi:uncharacterized protein BJ212DRAFT_939 [Suillus subaureus]|uniref:Uncharacterized protein n=1 Tax=Suillus subaureus TaxID=48587 RepID=A0A9P7JJN3_9AGAM|nr:uncharacterized protein BJ212DRAFT_939 [Suillus subaureus]KAG1826721.1 hypothetical protein BJ212DRAFT_939 [Suillus subaureus]
MDLIPFIGRDDHNHTTDCKLFWSDDVPRMAKELEVYLNPGAEQALEDFKQSRKYADSDIDHIAVCSAWSNKDDNRQLSRARELSSQNTELFQARLVGLGHDAKDVERMFEYHHYGVLDKELTGARWKRLIPKVERKLAELQEEWRLENQRKAIIPPQNFLKLCDVAEFIKSPPTEDKESDIYVFAEGFPDARYHDTTKPRNRRP